VAAVTFRQNSAAPSYTLLDAVPQTSYGLNFNLPQIADGPSGGGFLQTTFLLYNLSATPAMVTLSLAQDSGAPWAVNIPGLGSNNTFTVNLPAGGSAFLQTDGQGASTTGAAGISSTQPIGVSAVVTATDADDNFLSETAMTQSPPQQKFLLAFDTTNGLNTGLALYNAASQAVTLTVNQLDPGGNLVASAQSQPIGPGAHMTAYVSDLFPGTTGVQGALSVTATGWVGAVVAALALRQNATPLGMAGTPVASLPLTGTGINITSTLDSKSVATAAIQPAGGALSLTDAKGNKFTLTIPANALLSTTTVTMTAVTAIAGLPAGGSFNAGVQLEPDGLELFQPALLTIEPSSPPAPDTIIPLGWHGSGQGVYLNLEQPQSAKLTMVLDHFSGAGIGAGTDSYLTSKLLNIGNALELDQSVAAYWVNKERYDELLGDGGTPADMKKLVDINNARYATIQNFMQLALQSQDDDTLLCAINYALGYSRSLLLTPYGEDPTGAIGTAIFNFVTQASNIVFQHYSDRCKSTHNPLVGFTMVGIFRAGMGGGSFADLSTLLNQCSPAPTLNFQSEISIMGTYSVTIPPVGNSGLTQVSNGTDKEDFTVAATPTLTGTVTQDSFTGMGDGYTSYMLTGSAPLTYKSSSATAQTVSTDTGPGVDVTDTCTITVGGVAGSTLSVVTPSEIKYQFTPKYTATAVLKGNMKLAQFCPVYTTAPVSVSVVVNPGMPTETTNIQCSLSGSHPPATTMDWLTGWNDIHSHFGDGNTIANWQIPGSSSFAHKDISRSTQQSVTSFVGAIPGTITEKTTLDLNQPQQ
jgi:hypothetical protein